MAPLQLWTQYLALDRADKPVHSSKRPERKYRQKRLAFPKL